MAQPGTETPLSSTPICPSEANAVHEVIGSSSHPKSPSSKRKRGRPVGSKNKPKLPPIIDHHNHHAQKPIFIQVPRNSDVIEAVVKFARDYQVSVTVQSASGSILNATLRNSHSSTSAFIVHGPFTLVSLTGTCLYNNPSVVSSSSSSSSSSSNRDLCCSFRISIASNLGQSLMGVVGGKVIAGDDVNVAATVFKNSMNDNRVGTNGADEGGDNNNLNNVI
ncbi:unnamed protein product [Sphenostylis stenocarpa]|uniref:PPC domain-containing protein n=1 Tax=Sphenostylis stenocarpa TaxID=92480 RepID=A0AA86SRR5_9FABA|nr:unnamed protein product [Sphenostylis stenocarpa]